MDSLRNKLEPTIDDIIAESISFNGPPPREIGGFGFDKQGKRLSRGSAPLLKERQTPYPIIFSQDVLRNKLRGLKYSKAFQSAGIAIPSGSIVANRGCLISIMKRTKGILSKDMIKIVEKKNGLIYIGGDGATLEIVDDDKDEGEPIQFMPEAFGFNFEKTMTNPVVLQDSYFTVTKMDSFLEESTLYITCETDARDSRGRNVELKSKYNPKDPILNVPKPLSKAIITQDEDFDDLFRIAYHQMYLGNASILKYGFIEYGWCPSLNSQKPIHHVKHIFSWSLKEVAQKALKENAEMHISEEMGFLRSVLQWIAYRLQPYTKWEGVLELHEDTRTFSLTDAETFNASNSSEPLLEAQESSMTELQNMDEIRAEFSELCCDSNDASKDESNSATPDQYDNAPSAVNPAIDDATVTISSDAPTSVAPISVPTTVAPAVDSAVVATSVSPAVVPQSVAPVAPVAAPVTVISDASAALITAAPDPFTAAFSNIERDPQDNSDEESFDVLQQFWC